MPSRAVSVLTIEIINGFLKDRWIRMEGNLRSVFFGRTLTDNLYRFIRLATLITLL